MPRKKEATYGPAVFRGTFVEHPPFKGAIGARGVSPDGDFDVDLRWDPETRTFEITASHPFDIIPNCANSINVRKRR